MAHEKFQRDRIGLTWLLFKTRHGWAMYHIGFGRRTRKSGHRVTRTDMMRAQRAAYVAKRWRTPDLQPIGLHILEAKGRTGHRPLPRRVRNRIIHLLRGSNIDPSFEAHVP